MGEHVEVLARVAVMVHGVGETSANQPSLTEGFPHTPRGRSDRRFRRHTRRDQRLDLVHHTFVRARVGAGPDFHSSRLCRSDQTRVAVSTLQVPVSTARRRCASCLLPRPNDGGERWDQNRALSAHPVQ